MIFRTGSKGFVGDVYNTVSTVEEYDPATDTWTKKADMPTKRGRHSTSVVNGKIYAIGGSQNNWDALATVEVYDPALNQWSPSSDMPTARSNFTTSVVKGKIYALGGTTSNRSITLTAAVEEYDTGFSDEAEGSEGKAEFVLSGQYRARDGFELILRGVVGRTYRLQASNSLDPSSWIDVATLKLTQPTMNFLDTTAPNFPQRFYRVVSP